MHMKFGSQGCTCSWKVIVLFLKINFFFYTYLNIWWWFAKFWCMNNSTISSTNLRHLLILYQRKRVWIVTYSTTIYQMAFFHSIWYWVKKHQIWICANNLCYLIYQVHFDRPPISSQSLSYGSHHQASICILSGKS